MGNNDTLGKLDTHFLYENLQAKVKEMGVKRLNFSIFEDGGTAPACPRTPCKDWKVMAPDITSDVPAVHGKCRVMVDYWRINPDPVYSPQLENPTWRDLILATDALLQDGDGFGVFLENFYLKQDNGELLLEASIGS